MKNYPLLFFPFFLLSVAFGSEPISLFNGKDLTGWKKANYWVEDGAIVCKGGNLVSEKEYSNYVFEFEFLLPPGGNKDWVFIIQEREMPLTREWNCKSSITPMPGMQS